MLVYKYFTPSRTDVLQNLKLRFTPPGDFNDPFEFNPVLKQVASDGELKGFLDAKYDEILDASLTKRGITPIRLNPSQRRALRRQVAPAVRSLEPALLSKLRNEFGKTFNETFGVLCLSKLWDSILMWAHYGQSHEGFVVGFDAAHRFFNQRRSEADEFGYLRPVRYQKDRPVVSLMNSGGLEWFETKAIVWDYKEEKRMFLPLKQATEVRALENTKIHLFAYPHDCVAEVILGYKCRPETETAIRSVLGSWNSKPALFRANIDPEKYRVIRDPI